MNKTNVTSGIELHLSESSSKIDVTDDNSLNINEDVLVDATCVFCRHSILSGDHTKCVAKTLLTKRKKRTSSASSRLKTSEKSILGMPPLDVSEEKIEKPQSKTKKSPSAYLRKKAETSWTWQRWLQNTFDFKWLPKVLTSCVTNPADPTVINSPPVSNICDAGDSNRPLDC